MELGIVTKSCLLVSGGTAGHVLPSIEIARSLINQGVHVHWLGYGEKIEFQINSDKITYHKVLSRSPRSRVLLNIAYWKLLFSDIKVIRGLFKAHSINFTIVTGNFIGLIPGLISRWNKVPLYLYEQNSILGQANRLLYKLSQKVFWGMHPLRRLKHKEIYTSQPLRDEIITLKQQLKLYQARPDNRRPTLLIMGGSLGANFFNTTLIEKMAPVRHLNQWQIIHCAGKVGVIDKVQHQYKKHNIQALVLGYTEDIHSLYERADIVIARAGALSLSEILYLGKKALIIPMPNSVSDHQRYNIYSCLNSDTILYGEQETLDTKTLSSLLESFDKNSSELPQDKIAALCLED